MRTSGLWLVVLATTAMALLPAASGQTVADCQVDLLEADGNPSKGNFSVDQSRVFVYEATNTGDQDASADVFVSDHPPGWSWDTRVPSLSLSSGESQEIEIRVTYTGESSSDANFEIQLENVECTGTLPTDEEVTNGPQTATFSPDPISAGEDDDGFPWPWIVFGVLVAGAVVGVPAAYQARGPKVEATVEESEKDVIAGRGTSFPVTLKNKAKDAVPVKLEVVDVEEGWSALTTLPDLELGARETRTVYLMVRAPEDAMPGDLCVAKLQVSAKGGSTTTVKVLARVDEGASGGEEAPAEGDEVDEPDE